MLKRLHLKNFTVFADADFEFSPGLNVLVGTNGTGKSHVLKVGYALETTRFNISREFASNQLATSLANFLAWTATLYKVFPAVFSSSHLEPLIRWNTKSQTEVVGSFWGQINRTMWWGDKGRLTGALKRVRPKPSACVYS